MLYYLLVAFYLIVCLLLLLVVLMQQGKGGDMAVSLRFDALEDFEPGRIVDQVPALKALLDTRNKLRDLLSKADRSEDLESLLDRILQNDQQLKSLSSALGVQPGADAAGDEVKP